MLCPHTLVPATLAASRYLRPSLDSPPKPPRPCPQVLAAVVTCGGLCPGLNDVVQNIVYTLTDHGVPEDNILGIRCVV